MTLPMLSVTLADGTVIHPEPRREKGGAGSGNFGHAGRPGLVGGSGSGGAVTDTPEFKAWFKGSKVVNDDGSPRLMGHATTADISEFHEYSHFGTLAAAGDREETLDSFYSMLDPKMNENDVANRSKGSNIMPVYLRVTSPLRMPDLASVDSQTGEPLENGWESRRDDSGDHINYPRGWEGEEAVGTTLLEMGIIDIDEFEDGGRDNEGAFRILADRGYDGIVYKNVVEDAGQDSWIVFSPTQVKSAISNRGASDRNDPDIGKFASPRAQRIEKLGITKGKP